MAAEIKSMDLVDATTGQMSRNVTIGGVAAGVSIGAGSPILDQVENDSGASKTAATDILPVAYRNVPAPATPGTPLAAEVTEIDLTLSNHSGKTITATALVVSCSGGASFRGLWVVINETKAASVTAMTLSSPPSSADVSHHKGVLFCTPGITLIPYNEVISRVHILADDSTTEDNVVQVIPL